jgi:hypothetical protein
MDAPVYDDGCSLPNGGQGDRRDGAGDEGDVMYLAGYAPGMNQTMLEPGVIKKIPAGSRITLQGCITQRPPDRRKKTVPASV